MTHAVAAPGTAVLPLCWICRTRPADSGDHRLKASDLRAGAPGLSQAAPVFLQRGRATNDRIGSAKADKLKYPKSICRDCNSTLTQPYDLAWETLSAYMQANWPVLVKRGSFDLSKAFPGGTRAAALNVHLFFVKLLGCKLHEGSAPVDLAPFSQALLKGSPHPGVAIKIADTDLGEGRMMLYDSAVHARLSPAGELHGAVWSYQFRRVLVTVMYIKAGASLKMVGYPWHPSRPSKIVKLSPDVGSSEPDAGPGAAPP